MIRRLIAWLRYEPTVEFRRQVIQLLWSGEEIPGYLLCWYLRNVCGMRISYVRFYAYMKKLEGELLIQKRIAQPENLPMALYRMRVNL